MIYTYICPNGHEVDARGGVSDVSRSCRCGAVSRRRAFNHVAIVGETVPIEQRQGVRDFMEATREVDYHYTKAESEGMPVKRPNLYKEAKKKARAMGAQIR